MNASSQHTVSADYVGLTHEKSTNAQFSSFSSCFCAYETKCTTRMNDIQLQTEKEIGTQIREALRARRVAVGYTQAQAAARAGLSARPVQSFETLGVITLSNFIELLFVYRMERASRTR